MRSVSIPAVVFGTSILSALLPSSSAALILAIPISISLVVPVLILAIVSITTIASVAILILVVALLIPPLTFVDFEAPTEVTLLGPRHIAAKT